MTAHAMSGDRERYLAAGLDDYISKPISRDELAQAVARNCPPPAAPQPDRRSGPDARRSAENGCSCEAAIWAPGSASAEFCIDADAVLVRCGGDHDLMGELAGMFPVESRRLLKTLEQARAAGDLHGVQINAHTIKGMCGVFEASQAAGAALELERAAGEGQLGTEQQFQALNAELSRVMEAVTLLQTQH
jgi:HPt (histidine-containing phosphotransfer) domain-containing protein